MSEILLIGSQALARAGLKPREPRDTDFWKVGEGTAIKGRGVEIHYVPQDILDLVEQSEPNVASPNAVYTIKCSHANWDIHWQKTMSDIRYLRKKGAKKDVKLYSALYKHWLLVHDNKSRLSLAKTKEDFFTDGVQYIIDHDKLHEIVAPMGVPMYTIVRKEGEEVLIDREKFNNLEKYSQLRLFLEEVHVIMAERYLIPTNFEMSNIEAYHRALKKTIVDLTKNWAHEFMVDNYEFYMYNREFDWVDKVKEELNK